MKKIILVFLLLLFFCVTPAAALDYESFIPEKPNVLVKFNFSSFFKSELYNAMNVGSIKKAQDEMKAEFERRTGLLLERDVKEIVCVVGSGIDLNAHSPNNIAFYVAGKFDREKIFAALKNEKDLPFTVENSGGKVIIQSREGFKGAFLNNEVFVAGSPDMVDGYLGGKITGGRMAPDVKEKFEKSVFYARIEPAGKLREMMMEPRNIENIPAILKNAVEKFVSISFFDAAPLAMISAEFKDKQAAEEIKKMLDNAKGMAELFVISKEKEVEMKSKKYTAFDLLNPELIGAKNGAALVIQVLKSLETVVENNAAVVKISIPSEYSTFLKPEMAPVLVAVTGVMAAIAIPNFNRARTTARMKGCTANMKTLEGACELYMMENGAPSALTVTELVEKGYLKSKLSCPDSGSEYKLIFTSGKDAAADVECPKHGRLSSQPVSGAQGF